MRDNVRAFCAIAAAGAVLALPACSAVHGGASSGSAPSLSARTGSVTTGAPEPSNGSRAATAGSLTIAAVGDTMLGDTPNLPPDPASYFSAVGSTLDRGAQIVFGNLEGTLTTSTASK